MRNALKKQQREWAYKMWCLGYTHNQISVALNKCDKI